MGTLIYLYEIFIEKSRKEREVTSLELGKIMLFMCITFLVAGLIGCGIGYVLRKRLAEAKIESAEEKARQIAIDAQRLLDNTSREAQNLKKEAMMQTREEIHKLQKMWKNKIVNDVMNYRSMNSG